MTPDAGSHQLTSLRDYLRVLRRRKLVLLPTIFLVPLAALAFSLLQEKRYEASADVLLSRQNLATSLTGTPDPNAYQQADRLAQTQAELARTPVVAERVLRMERVSDRTPQDFLGTSSVVPKANADLLEFRVTDADPKLAMRLATEYAKQFSLYRAQLDMTAITDAREEVRARIRELRDAGGAGSPLYKRLRRKEQQLTTMEALQTSNALVVRPADTVVQVQPRPVRDALLGLALGLMLGIGLVFLREALDTRVRSAEEISERLGLPLLARLQPPGRRFRKTNKLVMLEEPNSIDAEGFRMLRTNLDFLNLERGARTIMVTSAVQSEGKSTTVANLAVALARAGRRVILVDLDLRRPYLDRFFSFGTRPGVTEVALGYGRLNVALLPVPLVWPEVADLSNGNGSGNGSRPSVGSLEVVCAGPIPPDGGEFVNSQALERTLEELRERCDILLIDAPPLLQVVDGMVLSTKVDAMIVVTRLDVVRRPMLKELRRVLDRCRADKLGFVLTGAHLDDSYPYDLGDYMSEPYEWAERELAR